MKAALKIPLLLFLLLLGIQSAHSQTPTQIIIANGGIFGTGNHVRVAAWNLTTGNYAVFDSFPAAFVHSVFIWGRDAYVCADSILARYNLDTYEREAMTVIPGVRQVAVWEDKVLVTKGFGAMDDHFDVRYAENLVYCFSLPEIIGNCEGVVVVGDTGYVANPVSFANPTGNMAVIDMRSRSLNRLMSLDTMGKFIDNMYVYHNKVVSVNKVRFNNPQWGFISRYDPATGFTHNKVDIPVSQGAGIDNGMLYANFDGNIGAFDLETGQLVDSIVVPGSWAAMVVDSINDRIYVTETDYSTFGWLYGYDYNGNRVDSLEIGISPEAIAVDYNVTVGTRSITAIDPQLTVYPQPFGNELHLDLRRLDSPAQSLAIYDLTGRKLLERPAHGNGILTCDLPELLPGAYVLQVTTRTGVASIQVVKTMH